MKFKNINDTLLHYLLDSPHLSKKTELRSLKHILFPCEKDIRLFLSENDYAEKLRLSKSIIGRITYETTTTIPFEFVSMILDYETKISAETIGSRATRDHYIHLVYIYLLGLYIYFYHDKTPCWICTNKYL